MQCRAVTVCVPFIWIVVGQLIQQLKAPPIPLSLWSLKWIWHSVREIKVGLLWYAGGMCKLGTSTMNWVGTDLISYEYSSTHREKNTHTHTYTHTFMHRTKDVKGMERAEGVRCVYKRERERERERMFVGMFVCMYAFSKGEKRSG